MTAKWRLLSINILFCLAVILLLARLFYWQVLAADQLASMAEEQQLSTIELPARRGEFLFKDNSFLTANKPAYFTYLIRNPDNPFPQDLPQTLSPYIFSSVTYSATPSAFLTLKDKQKLQDKAEDIIQERINNQRLTWIPLAHKINENSKEQLISLNLSQLFFEDEQKRLYPEASMAAHLIGFVGSDEQGRDIGYHGLEGYYQQELAGRPGIIRQEKDAFNQPILMGSFVEQERIDGRLLQLHLDKAIQYLVEKKLAKAIDQFKANSGSVTVMDPKTGAILAMASLPSYDPAEYYLYNKRSFLNPVVSDAFEPGSIFKIFVMAAALDTDTVKLDTKCDICDGPVKIDKYEIETWNKKYQPDATMTDVIVHSDNVGMVFVEQKLGKDKFLEYFKKFGFHQSTNIDLQDEVTLEYRPDKKWTFVDLATASFGQGFIVTGIQLLQAVTAIANDGQLVQPRVVSKVIGDRREITIPVKVKNKVISKQTADQITDMMVAAAKDGEAKWVSIKGHKIAGKTGTAQVVVEGKYAEEKTNASFIGFAPADNPKFAMLVTLKEPKTSPWASETAAPLWFSIAQDLLNYFNVVPEGE